jgi:hypothetical protein
VDTQRNVITIQTDHLSWWNPFSWNWGAWIAVLNKALTGNVTDFLSAAALLTKDCPQRAATVSVDASQAHNVIQGCVEHDDPSLPRLRIVNPKSFFFEVRPVSGGNGYPPPTMLGPGDDLTFQASTADPAPLVMQADITQKAGRYLVIHLIIQMLPGLNQLGLQGSQLACITERLADASYFVSASEALVAHDGAGAAEQLIRFLNNADAVRRFITATSDCSYGPAQTWSEEGLKQVGAATATIISATDLVTNYLLNNTSRVAFAWTRLSSTPSQVVKTPSVSNPTSASTPFTKTPVNTPVVPSTPVATPGQLPFDPADYADFIRNFRQAGVQRSTDLFVRAFGDRKAVALFPCQIGEPSGIPLSPDNIKALLAGTQLRLTAIGQIERPTWITCYGFISEGWFGKSIVVESSPVNVPIRKSTVTFDTDRVLIVTAYVYPNGSRQAFKQVAWVIPDGWVDQGLHITEVGPLP